VTTPYRRSAFDRDKPLPARIRRPHDKRDAPAAVVRSTVTSKQAREFGARDDKRDAPRGGRPFERDKPTGRGNSVRGTTGVTVHAQQAFRA